MTGHEDEVPVGRAFRIPLQIIFDLDRTSVFVDAQQREVEVEAGVGEVVGIAAEERHLLLRCKHEAYVGILLVPV